MHHAIPEALEILRQCPHVRPIQAVVAERVGPVSQSIEQKKAEILKFDPGKPEPLPVELFNKLSRKSTQLVNNEDETNFMVGRNYAYWFELEEPVFVSEIDVHVNGYSSFSKLEFSWKTQRDSSEQSTKSKIDDDIYSASINDVITAFCLKPPKQWFSDPHLEAVVVYGVTLEELDEVMEQFGDLDRKIQDLADECNQWANDAAEAEAKIATLTAEKTAIDAQITQFNTDRTTAAEDTEEAQSELNEVETALVSKRSEESDLVSRIEKIEDGIDQKKKVSQALNTEVTVRQRELKALKDDINMFPSEISGYVAQGADNIKKYSELALVPILILVLFVVVLFNNAADLSTVYKELEGVDLWTMLLSRVPFAIISVFIIHACYKITKMFIFEVIQISNRRLDLSKVSIVAKDVSDTSARDLDFSDDEIYELNTKLKMDMLKSHLKGYVADDYEYDIDITLVW